MGRIEEWDPVEAPARRRRWFDSHQGTMAVLLASASDLDDLIPTLVAYQVEWNKLHAVLRASDSLRTARSPTRPRAPTPTAARPTTGCAIHEAWGDLSAFLREVTDRRLNLRIRMLGGSQAGYARMTRRWWRPVRSAMEEQGLGDRPVYFVSCNPHSLVNLVTPTARAGEAEIVRFIETHGPEYLREELERFRAGRGRGLVGELPLLRRAAAVGVAARRTARSGGGASRPSARSASRTSPAARRCACRHRSWRSRSSTRPGSTRGSAPSTPSGWPPARR